MENEIIDLTHPSPTPDSIVLSSDDQSDPAIPRPQAKDKRKPRRKKRKRSMLEGDSQSSAAQTREPSETPGGQDNSNLLNSGQGEGGLRPSRHRSDSPHRKRAPPQSPKDDTNAFFVDLIPASLPVIPSTVALSVPPNQNGEDHATKLLLPVHVSVFGKEPVEILPSSIVDPDGSDYIEYLDYDDRKDLLRYFEDPVDDTTKKSNKIVCKNCGAEGEHKTVACPVLICLTCGARNEHPTRSCPISKKCFTCGMKGHINATCPNRKKSSRNLDPGTDSDCDRCGSLLHKKNECTTLWRLYEYLPDDEKHRIIYAREDRKEMSLGQGGEGYIGGDEWCYNCGHSGHWGDDCQDIPHRGDLPDEPSAFSAHNTLSGPFFDHPLQHSLPSRRRKPRDWETAEGASVEWVNKAPGNIGRQARRKNIAKMGKRAHEQDVEEDPDDWFRNPRRSQSDAPIRDTRIPSAPKKMTFGKSLQSAGRNPESAVSRTSLLERLGRDSHRNDSRMQREQLPESRSSRIKHDDGYFRPQSGYNDEHDHGRDHGYQRREGRGPRYKGGYGR